MSFDNYGMGFFTAPDVTGVFVFLAVGRYEDMFTVIEL